MSIVKKYYIIAGYDLTGYETNKFRDWKWSDEGEQYTCNQVKDEIQLFDDPMNGEHLYLGWVLATGDEYEFKTEKITMVDISYPAQYVHEVLVKLQELGIITKDYEFKPKYQVIAFEECT